MSDWILLLPPSEGKATPDQDEVPFSKAFNNKRTNYFKTLNPSRETLLNCLEEVLERRGGWEEIFEVKGKALEEAMRSNRFIKESPTLRARDLYNGVMYQAIQYDKLKRDQKKLFDKQTIIFSGLFGIVKPTDRIPPYKLKAGANLGGVVGKVTNFWRNPVSEALKSELRNKVVWNLLPDQHQKMWDNKGEFKAMHTVKFVKKVVRSGIAEWKTISHHSKSLKGALIQFLLEKDACTPKELQQFTHPDGYQYMPSLSVNSKRASQLVFGAE